MEQEYKFLMGHSDEIRIEVFRRDLTKRQKAIVWMIHLFSYSMGKREAIIPQLKDFECCGVAKSKIKSELETLVELKVISWKQEINTFFILHPSEWDISTNNMWDQSRFDAVYELNLKHK